jgi:WhiB family transcriptional regulator, redox-sensing transcriptional regulator
MTSHTTTRTDDDLTSLAEAVGVYRDWRDQAACRAPWVDNTIFFPADHHSPNLAARDARQVCGGCPVRSACLEWALGLPTVEDHGIAGGTSPKERKRLRAARRGRSA